MRLVLAWYLALYIAVSGPITSAIWARGGHVTPEQWAIHEMLDQLGIHHHHDAAGIARAVEGNESGDIQAMILLAVGTTPLITAPGEVNSVLDATPLGLLATYLTLVYPRVEVHLGIFDPSIPAGVTAEPPEKPPSPIA